MGRSYKATLHALDVEGEEEKGGEGEVKREKLIPTLRFPRPKRPLLFPKETSIESIDTEREEGCGTRGESPVSKQHRADIMAKSLPIKGDEWDSEYESDDSSGTDKWFIPRSSFLPEEDAKEEPRVLLCVVLTLARDKPKFKGKPADYRRRNLLGSVHQVIAYNDMEVIDGPYLDENYDMKHPHVNMTINAPLNNTYFDYWKVMYGGAHVEPVRSYRAWSAYSRRNHDMCVKLNEGEITKEEAKRMHRLTG